MEPPTLNVMYPGRPLFQCDRSKVYGTVDRTFFRLLLAGAIAGTDRIEEASGFRLKGLRLIAKVLSAELLSFAVHCERRRRFRKPVLGDRLLKCWCARENTNAALSTWQDIRANDIRQGVQLFYPSGVPSSDDLPPLFRAVASAEAEVGTEMAEEMISEDSDVWPLELPAPWLVVQVEADLEVTDKDTFTAAIAVANGVSYSWIDDFRRKRKET